MPQRIPDVLILKFKQNMQTYADTICDSREEERNTLATLRYIFKDNK